MKRALPLALCLTAALAQSGAANDPWILYQRPTPPPSEAKPSTPPPPPSLNLPSLPGTGTLPGLPALPGSPLGSGGETPETLFPPGALVKARLLTGVYLVPGKTVPVAAEAVVRDAKVVLVGRASFDVTGRVWVEFTTAVVKDQVYPVYAVGLEAEEVTQGLPAKVGEEAPTLLADLIRGSLGGISDFVKATLEATTVTTAPGGGQVVQRNVPGIELFLLARAADLVAVPRDTRAVIRTVKVERDTPLFLLFLPGGDRETGEAAQGVNR